VQTLKLTDVPSDHAAPITRYADCGMTCLHARKQNGTDKQTRYKFHFPRKIGQTELLVLRDARNGQSLVSS
jgi:hypothetical protein